MDYCGTDCGGRRKDLKKKKMTRERVVLLSPQLDEPVEDKEDEKAEEEHVAQQFGLAASGQLFHSADGGAKQSACWVKVCVLVWDRGVKSVKSRQAREHTQILGNINIGTTLVYSYTSTPIQREMLYFLLY